MKLDLLSVKAVNFKLSVRAQIEYCIVHTHRRVRCTFTFIFQMLRTWLHRQFTVTQKIADIHLI